MEAGVMASHVHGRLARVIFQQAREATLPKPQFLKQELFLALVDCIDCKQCEQVNGDNDGVQKMQIFPHLAKRTQRLKQTQNPCWLKMHFDRILVSPRTLTSELIQAAWLGNAHHPKKAILFPLEKGLLVLDLQQCHANF